MKLLKQSTASTVIVGPVLDANGAAVTNAVVGDFKLAKNGTTATLSGATVTHDANGYYTVALTTGNTDTVGRLAIYSGNTAHSMATHHWTVLLASVFDAILTNATNSTGGLVTATGSITALAGAISTLTAAGVRTELATELGRIDTTVSSRLATSGYTAPPSASTNATAVRTELATELARIDVSISSRSTLTAGGVRTELAIELGRIDAAISSRMATFTLPTNFSSLAINSSGHVSRVTLVDTTTTNTDMRGTDGAALASAWTATRAGYLDASITSRLAATSYTAPDNATISSISSNLVIINDNVLTRLSALAYTAPPSAATNATAVRTELGVELARIDAAITSRLAATSYTAPDNASIGSIKSVTDKLNTTMAADGLLWQFTINALENAPGGGGGGSATLENQELILANLDNVTGAVAAAVARLQLETQITGFPATLCRGSDYDTIIESEIRLQLLDLDNEPITEIGGTPVDEITWLFGFGTDRQPRLVEGACSWDDVTNELVIELSADDTEDTPLGAATWQIGAQIGELIRWLGGGTTRVIERQFTA